MITLKDEVRTPEDADSATNLSASAKPGRVLSIDDLWAFLPSHSYLYVPTQELWPGRSVDGQIATKFNLGGRSVRASAWLDAKKAIVQMVWDPREPQLIRGRVMRSTGYVEQPDAVVFNQYQAPVWPEGDGLKATPWRDHLRRLYPEDCGHLEDYLAYKIQHPGRKINHAIVLGGAQGIGKDSILEPVKAGIGACNWQEISPGHLQGRFNGWARCVMLRINEARDVGEANRIAIYEAAKIYLAAPPDALRVDEKNIPESYVANVCGVVITTNHRTDGLYLPPDDRRHFVAWSEATREDFPPNYWADFHNWCAEGGVGHVIAYLASKDLSHFDPMVPPCKTPAFWAIAQSGESHETADLCDVIDHMGSPDALTIGHLVSAAKELGRHELAAELVDRKFRRTMPTRLDKVGYVTVRNANAADGMFKISGRRQTAYAHKRLSPTQRMTAADAIR